MLNYTLAEHRRDYTIEGAGEKAWFLLNAKPWADRHLELANLSGTTKAGHKVIAYIYYIPIFGQIAALIERIVIWAHRHFSSQERPYPTYQRHLGLAETMTHDAFVQKFMNEDEALPRGHRVNLLLRRLRNEANEAYVEQTVAFLNQHPNRFNTVQQKLGILNHLALRYLSPGRAIPQSVLAYLNAALSGNEPELREFRDRFNAIHSNNSSESASSSAASSSSSSSAAAASSPPSRPVYKDESYRIWQEWLASTKADPKTKLSPNVVERLYRVYCHAFDQKIERGSSTWNQFAAFLAVCHQLYRGLNPDELREMDSFVIDETMKYGDIIFCNSMALLRQLNGHIEESEKVGERPFDLLSERSDARVTRRVRRLCRQRGIIEN